MKIKKILLAAGLMLGLGVGAVAGIASARPSIEAKATTEKTFYLDCTNHDYDTYDSICLHLWGTTPGDKYYQASQAGDNYWSVTIPDIDGFSGAEFYKCNSVAEDHNSATNLYYKQSWLSFPSDNYYYSVSQDIHSEGDDNKNWSAPAAWYLTGDSSATLSASKFDSDGLQFYSTAVTLAENDVIEFTDGTATSGYSDFRTYNGLTAKEKGQVVDNGDGKVKVVTPGTYEIYVNAITGKVWMQSDRATEIKDFAQKFNAAMATPCADEDANNATAVSAIWGTWKTNFENLTEGAKEEFGTSNDTDVVQARSLYLHCVSRYGLAAWDDAPSSSNELFGNTVKASSPMPIIVIAIASAVILGFGSFVIIRKRKQQF